MTIRATKRLAVLGAAALCLAGCAGMQNVQHMVSSPCHDTTVTFYFESGSEAVTDVGRQIIAATAHQLKSCKVKELKLVGLADPAGSAQINLTLSQHRADNVLDAFVKAGLPVPKYSLIAAGDKGAVTANGVVEPVRRRVDATVVVRR